MSLPSRRAVARHLESVTDFADPSAALEQYLTPPEVAAHVCHHAAMAGDLVSGPVADLGTGTGMLALGAACYTEGQIVGLDVDRTALQTARENGHRLDAAVSWVLADAQDPPLTWTDATVLSNPPFGAQHGHRGADRAFLRAAAAIGRVSYTIHNEGSLSTVEAVADSLGGTVTEAYETALRIDHRFSFHTAESVNQRAEVIRIEWH